MSDFGILEHLKKFIKVQNRAKKLILVLRPKIDVSISFRLLSGHIIFENTTSLSDFKSFKFHSEISQT